MAFAAAVVFFAAVWFVVVEAARLVVFAAGLAVVVAGAAGAVTGAGTTAGTAGTAGAATATGTGVAAGAVGTAVHKPPASRAAIPAAYTAVFTLGVSQNPGRSLASQRI